MFRDNYLVALPEIDVLDGRSHKFATHQNRSLRRRSFMCCCAGRASVTFRKRYAAVLCSNHRARSSTLILLCITNAPEECSINRYYDPATDQFLSIDPDVAQTNQPYVFTNDDPLNATDPMGLCWGCSFFHAVAHAADDAGSFVRKNSSAVLGIEFDTASIILDVSAILEPDPFVSGAAIVLGAIGTKLDISACDAGSQLGCVGKDVGEVGIGAGVAAS